MSRAGELRTVATPAEDTGLIPGTYMETPNKDSDTFGFYGHYSYFVHIYTCRKNKHIHKNLTIISIIWDFYPWNIFIIDTKLLVI